MAAEIKDASTGRVIANGSNAVQKGEDYLIDNIFPYPNNYLNEHVQYIFKIKDTNLFQEGVLLQLVTPPHLPKREATFKEPL